MAFERDADGRIAASTAEGAAALRAVGATERDPAVRCPDSLAAAFITRGGKLTALARVPAVRRLLPLLSERIIPGSYGYELARVKHVDTVLRDELAAGLEQLLILGAGYDSRALRFADALRDVPTFEVDHPAMQRRKRARVEAAFGPPPPHLRYVPVDLDAHPLLPALDGAGYDTARRTLVIFSGVGMYLPEPAVAGVLDFVAGHAPGSALVFDYLWSEVLEGTTDAYGARELVARTARMGEPLRSGIRRGASADYLAAHGLELVEELGADQLEERYLRRRDGSLHRRCYGFGSLALARVGR
jgi:methyltransferase (TIGR00027 family)